MKTLLSKIALPVILTIAGFAGGMVTSQRLAKPVALPEYKCPDCNCPAVSVQPFQMDKMKGVRSFSYAPQFSGSIQIAGVDSTILRRMIDESISKAFERYDVKARRTSNRFTGLFREADSVFDATVKRASIEASRRTDQQLGL